MTNQLGKVNLLDDLVGAIAAAAASRLAIQYSSRRIRLLRKKDEETFILFL